MSFNFRSLIKRHTCKDVYALIETKGSYDFKIGGDYIKGEILKVPLLYAAVVPIPQDEIKQANGGYYSHDAKKLYTYTAIAKGTEILIKDDKYKITGVKDYSENDKDLYIYYLERVNTNEHN